MNEARVIISGEIGPDNGLGSLLGIKAQLAKQSSYEDFVVDIDSPGGGWVEGMAMYDWLRSQPIPFGTRGIGRIGSIATGFFLAAPVEKRGISKHSEFFIHLPSGEFKGVADEGLAYYQDVKNKEAMLIDLYVERAGVDRAWVTEKMRAQTALTAAEAVQHGFAGYIIDTITADDEREPVTGRVFAYEAYLKDGLGKKRSQMPQVPLEELDKFRNYFEAKYGTGIISRMELPLNQLKPSQAEFDHAKINSKAQSGDWKTREYIASSQMHLLDGHHDWAAGLEKEPEYKVKVMQIGLPSEQLIAEANKLRMTTSEPVKKASKPSNYTIMNKKVLSIGARFKMAAALLRGEVKALAVTAPDGSSADVTFTSDPPAVGDAAFTGTGDPAADGNYTLPDGQVAMVAGGMVTEINAAAGANQADPAAQAAKTEDANKAILARLDSIEASMKAADPMAAKITALETTITALKGENSRVVKALSLITGDTTITRDEDTDGKGTGKGQLTQEQALEAHAKRKADKAAKK